ncbi:MAG TPA: malto-oligosyltrehalose synthase [Terriglobales bacterium]|nr:malto-oligosyltrehalose synthase [Terriglobales bacterium]
MRANVAALMAESVGLAECLDRLAARRHADRPVSTYRLQFNREFRFVDARALVPYLHALGVTHCYSSPLLKARAGSAHGYDITDHNSLNPEIGSEEEFHALVSELHANGMALILDTVPNHMGVGHGDNPWWQDVLQNGRSSAYADFFDIDWEPFKPELRDKVLFPVLGGSYGVELERGHLRLKFDGSFFVQYFDKHMPVDPQTIPLIFEPLGDLRVQPVEIPEAERAELEDVLFKLRQLPPNNSTDPQPVSRRRSEAPALLQRLQQLAEHSGASRSLIESALAALNGEAGIPRSFDWLHRLLDAQPYRLAHWLVSGEEINYRRFFDVNDLAGLRMENPRVFAATHQLLRRLLADGSVAGLRIDHPDGLLNPPQYFIRLQMLYAASQCCGTEPHGPIAENGIEEEVQTIFGQHEWMQRQAPLFVVLEKILEPGEHLPAWPIDGTVGYGFTNLLNGIFIDSRNRRSFTRIYERFIGGVIEPDTVIYEAKNQVMNTALASEVAVLTNLLDEISSADRHARDFTAKSLATVIRETIACFPVYRTYIDERGNVSELDRAYIDAAVARAKRRNEAMPASVFDFLRNVLLLQGSAPGGDGEQYRKWLYFVLKFQQLSGPVMAKGLEDTACYVYNRLTTVNEVGGSPAEFGFPVEEFHRGNLERAQKWPHALLLTSSHDTKRSEDVRARLNVLSEMPRDWSAAVMRWRRMNQGAKITISDGRMVPDANEEYLLYQTLVGAWPFAQNLDEKFVWRIQRYMNKAVHEAKVNLSWVNDNPEYVHALNEFIARIFTPGAAGKRNPLPQRIEEFVRPVAYFGVLNSLAQVLLKITAPGVPDFYQGNELWEFRLVDPDNRYQVDFALRARLLDELLRQSEEGRLIDLCSDMMANYQDGRIKLWVSMRALNFRREHRELFRAGSYAPLSAANDKQEHVVAFARSYEDRAIVAAVPRFSYTLMRGRVQPPIGEVWGNAELQLPAEVLGTRLLNIFTGEEFPANGRTLPCRQLFAFFPVALLAAY